MKIVIVVALFLAGVFKSDCHHFNDEPTNQVSTFEANLFPAGPEKTKFTDEVDETEQNDIYLRGKGGKGIQGILQTLKRKLEFLENNLTQANMKMEKDIELIKDSQTNITNADKELQLELNLAMENISNGDLHLKEELISHNSTIISKLNFIDSQLDTIGAAVLVGKGPLRHFPYANNTKTWADAKAYCESIGGEIWTPINRNETIAVYRTCGTLCWNGWHKNSGGVWVTGKGEVKNSNFWGSSSEPNSSDDAAWSDSNGLWGRSKNSRYGWTCQM